MATFFFNSSSSSKLHRPYCPSLPSSPYCSPYLQFSLPSRLHRQTLLFLSPPGTARSLAVGPGPPSPPGPELPPPRNTNELAGIGRAISRIQERSKIFMAVLFWMSLFFWASASDWRDKGKRKKGSRFK